MQIHLLAQDKLEWHLELHIRFALKHLYRFVLHLLIPAQLHFVKPCPFELDCLATACRNETVVVLISSVPKSHWGHKLVSWIFSIQNSSFNADYVLVSDKVSTQNVGDHNGHGQQVVWELHHCPLLHMP